MNVELNRKLDDAQDEYLDIMIGLSTGRYDITGDDNGFRYYWEHSKQLQIKIINLVSLQRQIGMDDAKEQLENAFTPKLKNMLKKNIQNDIAKEKSNE
jgi:hypothetical protein